jgi:predicted branched-subunit amino acid permease
MSVSNPAGCWAHSAGCFRGILPGRIISALSIALYAMFIAVIVPRQKGNRLLMGIILTSMMMSLLFAKISILNQISQGFKIIILTVLIAGTAALLFR